MDINNKVTIVTGGASGLGEATVLRYHDQGAKIAIFDLNDERGEALINELGCNTSYHNIDVSDESSVSHAMDEVICKFGAVHICNNSEAYPTLKLSRRLRLRQLIFSHGNPGRLT